MPTTTPGHKSQQAGAGAGRVPYFGLAGKRGKAAPPLVDYILVAEFDIDSGSTVRHAYPSSVPGVSDDWFAEHMLPEGAHNHTLDWTVMFLNRDKTPLDEDWPPAVDGEETSSGGRGHVPKGGSSSRGVNEMRGESYDPRLAHGCEGGGGERNFLHCMNLVRKQDDPTARRGAVVKAMCVCSQYNYIEVFRPMLMVALLHYFETQAPEVLAWLFQALNAADIAGAPRPTPWERGLMRRYMGTVPIEHLTTTWTYNLSFDYGDDPTVQAPIPLSSFPDETLTPSVTLLVNLFGQSVMTIYNAVLTGRRVLFVGYNHAAGDVCKIVLAACALVSPPVHGMLRRAFPYASLSDLSFLETPSFVAGVTNPVFEAHPEWWDVLCQLDLPRGSGSVVTAEEMLAEGGGGPGAHRAKSSGAGNAVVNGTYEDRSRLGKDAALLYPGDIHFATKLLAGVKSGKGESWARCECHDYTQGLVNLVLDKETRLPGQLSSVSLDKLMTVNDGRLRRLRVAAGITEKDADPWSRCRGPGGGVAARGRGMQLRNYIRRIQLEKSVGESSVGEAFELLAGCLETEAELQVLLGLLPESKGGAGLLALGLLSTSAGTRRNTVKLFKKLEYFESTRPAVLCMNDFFKLALSRQANDLENGSPSTPIATGAAGAAASAGASASGGAGGSAIARGGGGGVNGRRSLNQ